MITRTAAFQTTDQKTFQFITEEKVLDVLTTTKTSKSAARKVNGGTKRRVAKPASTPEERNT